MYRYCVVQDKIVIHNAGDPEEVPCEPALLRTCKQIRGEALDIYYQENVFDFVIDDNNAKRLIR